MYKFIIVCCCTFLMQTTYAQTQASNDLITEGSAKMKIAPDVARFKLTIDKRDTSEKKVIKALNQEVDNISKSLNKLGFPSKSIQISEYEISSSIDDRNKKRYNASNVLKLEFALDNTLIDAFYKEIETMGIKDVDIVFESLLSDSLERNTRLQLTKQAIADAKINANNIATALNVKIVGIKQVQKGSAAILEENKVEVAKFTPSKVVREVDIKYDTPFKKYEVEKVELEEKITVIYAIAY